MTRIRPTQFETPHLVAARRLATLLPAVRSIALFCALLGALLPSSRASAGSFYYEIAGGMTQMHQEAAFFNTQGAATQGLGFALGNAVFVNFGSGAHPVELQLGVLHRFESASGAGGSFTIQSVYPALRLQISKLYLSAGATPWVWHSSPSSQIYTTAQGTTMAIGELGLLWPITPQFSLSAAAAMQYGIAQSSQSPSPMIDGTIAMRFYFGFWKANGSGGSNEFHGWRYPFGRLR